MLLFARRRFSTGASRYRPAKLANLGSLIDIIHDNTPNLIQRTYPEEILDPDVTLRLLPDTHPHLPVANGRSTYKASFRLAQLLVATLLVPGDSKLEILSSRLQEHHTSINSHGPHSLHGHSHIRHDPHPTEPTLVSSKPPRLFIRWRTLAPEKSPAEPTPKHITPVTSSGYLNYSWSSSLSKIDPRNFGILPDEYPVLTGIFVFDFNMNCTSIMVHTITDLEYLTSTTADPKVIGA